MAIVEGQTVKVRWNSKHKKYYESIKDESGKQKYKWTKPGAEFEVDLNDLPKGSQAKIKFICDYCGKISMRSYINYLKYKNESKIKKDCCLECKPLKSREMHGTLNEEKIDFENESEGTHKNGYEKDFLINEFWRYYKEFGVYPKKSDLISNPDYPGDSGYVRIWGSWTNFINSLGIMGEDGWYKCDEKILLNLYDKSKRLSEINEKLMVKRSVHEILEKAKRLGFEEKSFYIKRTYDIDNDRIQSSLCGIVDLYKDIGKFPTVLEYEEYARLNKLLDRRSLERKINKKYNDLLHELIDGANQTTKSKEQLLDELRLLKEKLGRTPMANELVINGLSEKKVYMRKFKMTYQELIEWLGWDLSSPKLNFKTEEELLDDYNELYKKLGRLPLHQDLRESDITSSYATYLKYFGSFKNIWDLLEIDYSKEVLLENSYGVGFTCIDKNGDICRSEPEMIITNLFIDNGINYEKEKLYSEVIDGLLNTWKMDWFLPDYNIIVEYFGMYQGTQLNRNTRIGKYSRKAKRKIKFCSESNVNLIDLYYDDTKNNYKGVRDKLNKYDILLENVS